jgi:hypothetical protein
LPLRYNRIIAELAVNPVPVIVTETVELVFPDVGEMAVTVAAVAVLTVKDVDVVPPSVFRTTSVQVPASAPFRLKLRLSVVALSVPTTVPVIVDCPVFVRVTATGPLNPDPVITTVCPPLFAALVGEILVIVGVEA